MLYNPNNIVPGLIPFHDKRPAGPAVQTIDELVSVVKSPKDLLETFMLNKVQYDWESDPKKGKFPFMIKWPNYIFNFRMGICLDFAIFAHFVFQKLNIKHAIALTIFVDERPGEMSKQIGHAYVIFKETVKYKIWNYFYNGIGDINGDFTSYQEAIDKCGPYFDVLYKSEVLMPGSEISHYPRACVSTFFEDGKDLKFIDKALDTVIFQNALFQSSYKFQKLLIDAATLRKRILDADGRSYEDGYGTIEPVNGIKFTAPTRNENILKKFLSRFNYNTI